MFRLVLTKPNIRLEVACVHLQVSCYFHITKLDDVHDFGYTFQLDR